MKTVNKKGKQNAVVMVIFRVGPPEVLVAVKVTKGIVLQPICLHYMRISTKPFVKCIVAFMRSYPLEPFLLDPILFDLKLSQYLGCMYF